MRLLQQSLLHMIDEKMRRLTAECDYVIFCDGFVRRTYENYSLDYRNTKNRYATNLNHFAD